MSVHSRNWQRLSIIGLCEAHVDCVNRTAPVVSEPTLYKMLRTTNVRNGYVDTENVRYVTEETYKRWTRRLVPKRGDIVLTREAPLGDVGKIRTDDAVFLGQRLYHFRPDPKQLNADFLLYSLLGEDLQSQIRGFGSGSTVEHMRLEDIPSLEINVPPLPIQQRIAGILSAYDELIENSQRRIKILEAMARALYREWFVHFRFPGHEHHPRVASPLGEIPQGWEVADLDAIKAEQPYAINGGPFGSKLVSRDYVASGVPVIRGSNLSESGRFDPSSFVYVSEEKASELHANLAKPGDIVVTQRGTLGQIGMIPNGVGFDKFVISQSQMKITVNSKLANREYVFFFLRSEEAIQRIKNLASSSGVPHINLAVLREFKILLPPIELQASFGQFALSTETAIEGLSRQIDNLRRTRDLLLPRLLSGQIDVEAA